MRTALLLVALLVLPAPVAAQVTDGPLRRAVAQAFQRPGSVADAERVAAEAARLQAERAERARLNLATWVYVSSAAADWSVTAACYENPTCGDSRAGLFLHGVKPQAGIPIGLAIDAAIVLLVREVLAPEHPRIAEVLLYGLSGARVAWTIGEVHNLRR